MSSNLADRRKDQENAYSASDYGPDDDDDSIDESVLESSGTGGSNSHALDSKHDNDNANLLANRETRQIRLLKLLVVAVLVFAATGVAAAVFLLTQSSETTEFEGQFNELANKVLESIGSSLDVTYEALDTLAATIVSTAAETNQTFPYVTVPDFGLHGVKTLASSALLFVILAPVIEREQRLSWEAYTAKYGREQIDDVLRVQATDETASALPIYYNYSLCDVLFTDRGFVPYNITQQQFLPSWQTYPVAVDYWPYNWDYSLSLQDAANVPPCINHRKVVLSQAYMVPNPAVPDEVETALLTANWFKFYLPKGEEKLAPASDILFPVFNSRDSAKVNTSLHPTEAVLIGSFYWRDMIRNILPPGSDGVLVVFENPCNPSFTYMLRGPRAEYIGYGDQHNPKYEHLGIRSSIFDLNSYRIRASKYAGPPLDDERCSFSFHLYPSEVLEAQYVTNKPAIYMIAVVCIFTFASFVFCVYDFTVERRQHIVMNTAKKSSAVV